MSLSNTDESRRINANDDESKIIRESLDRIRPVTKTGEETVKNKIPKERRENTPPEDNLRKPERKGMQRLTRESEYEN